MHTFESILTGIRDDDWATLIDVVEGEIVKAVIWTEPVENKHGRDPWKTAYMSAHFHRITGEWIDTYGHSSEEVARAMVI